MVRSKTILLWGLLISAAGVLVSLDGCGGGSSAGVNPPPNPNGKIKHVVIIFQENRTPDNLFHDPALIANGADIASSGMNSHGVLITLGSQPLAYTYDLSHRHAAFVDMYDGGKMDGADLIPATCSPNHPDCVIPSDPQFKYVQASDVAPYFQMAEQYTFADRMFQTNQGPSFPAHQFIIAGTSAPTASSDLFVAENTSEPGVYGPPAGCTAPPDVYVQLIDPTGDESNTMYPCFEHPTLMDMLDAKNVSWRYYSPSARSIWTAPNAIQHLRMGPDWDKVILNSPQILTDIANGQLAAVNWVIPTGASSDHSGTNDGSGPSWVASVVNAIGNSKYWSDTAILIAWDDWGGWYDHVAPRVINSYEYGFRVPLIVVSPYAKPGYISHVTHDFGSLLKFIETTFAVASVGYADDRADDLSDCFDFNQTPLTFRPISAQLDSSHFLKERGPDLDPDDDN